jgi:hypothetical protein
MVSQWTKLDHELTRQVQERMLLDVGVLSEKHEETGAIAKHLRRPCSASEQEPLLPLIAARHARRGILHAEKS